MRRVRKEIKDATSSLLMCTTLGIGMANLGAAANTYHSKVKLGKETDTKKIEYYDKMIKVNKTLIDNQIKELNNPKTKDKIKLELYNDVIKIPDKYSHAVFESVSNDSDTHKYLVTTKTDLKTIKEIELDITNEVMPGFLYYCTNLEDLKIKSYHQSEISLSIMPSMPSVKKFTLDSELEYFNKKQIETFFRSMPYMEDLTIESMAIFEPGILESLKQLKRLEINPTTNCDINFKELDHLKELKIDSEDPYDIAIWFNSEEYNYLKEKCVKITFKDGVEEEYLKVSDKLDNIINSLNINENSTDDEILTEILKYATTHYQYDEDVSESLKNGTPRKEGKESISFYKGGWLYGALERDTQICGNYAAFVEAMYDRLYEPEKSYMLMSNNHCWNAIDFEGKRYYVDSTWFDGNEYQYGEELISSEEVLEKDLGRFTHWYKEDPNSSFIKNQEENDTHESHIPENEIEYTENGFVKESITVTTPVTTRETQKTTTTFALRTEKIDASEIDKEKLMLNPIYDNEMKKYTKKAIFFLSLSLLIKIKKTIRNKKEKKLVKRMD